MIKFNLEKALSGAKVITRDGREVTQLHLFDASDEEFPLNGVIDNVVYDFRVDGTYLIKNKGELDLFMGSETLSGFVNVYRDNNQASYYTIHENKEQADMAALEHRTACIDLSQFPVGHGLEDE